MTLPNTHRSCHISNNIIIEAKIVLVDLQRISHKEERKKLHRPKFHNECHFLRMLILIFAYRETNITHSYLYIYM